MQFCWLGLLTDYRLERFLHSSLKKTSDGNVSSLPTLCHRVRLYISIVVLAGPDEASLRFHGLGHHVVDETVLIPDTFGLKLSTIFPEHTRRWTTPLSCDLHLQMCVLAIAKERDRVCMCCAKDSQVLTSRRSPGRCL